MPFFTGSARRIVEFIPGAGDQEDDAILGKNTDIHHRAVKIIDGLHCLFLGPFHVDHGQIRVIGKSETDRLFRRGFFSPAHLVADGGVIGLVGSRNRFLLFFIHPEIGKIFLERNRDFPILALHLLAHHCGH